MTHPDPTPASDTLPDDRAAGEITETRAALPLDGAAQSDVPQRPVVRARRLDTIRVRRDFLTAARAAKWTTPAMIVQARERRPAEAQATGAAPRVGFTCSKKVGNAVLRNRAKRRLRAVAAEVLPQRARPGWDYVLIGRAGATVSRDFAAMVRDLEAAVDRLHQPPRAPRSPAGRESGA